eukprot:5993654-Ditylum_brightwellii.AAC.1
MSGWRPKTSKLGGLPNISLEPCKPVPLGTMFKNGVECISSILFFQDIVQGPEKQQKKKNFGVPSILGSDITIPFHTSEVLRHVEVSNILAGGCVGGDSWFGSITTSV